MASIAYTPYETTSNNVGRDYIDNRRTTVNNVMYQDIVGHSKKPIDRLLERIAPGAFHDSEERGSDAPKCHPETRKAVQEQIMSWIRHGDQDDEPKQILWLSGPAGSGKTAIAGTIADECDKEGLVASTFFFSAYSESSDRRSNRSFVLTLAYGLMQQRAIVGLKAAVLCALEDDPMILRKHLDRQMDQLILNPLRVVAGQSNPALWPKVVIIDGLDECGADAHVQGSRYDVQRCTEDSHKAILRVLARGAANPSFPFRILIASRPDPAIKSFFQSPPDIALRIFLDNQYNPDYDIRLFLVAKLNAVQREFSLPSDWPPQHVVDILVDNASGQFIYAATALRFVEDGSRPPQEQLELILHWSRRNGCDSNPFASLDSLYTGILHMSPDPALAGKWIVCLTAQWGLGVGSARPSYSVGDWYKKAILESSSGEIAYLLRRMSSLISISEDSGPSFVVNLYHKSILDFLGDANRSSGLYVSEKEAEQYISDCHYHTLKNRGCRGSLNPNCEAMFLGTFVECLGRWIDPLRSYDVDDVAWWWAEADNYLVAASLLTPVACALIRQNLVRDLFFSIDKGCSLYSCSSSCKLWRKAIQRHGMAARWERVPTLWDLLREKAFKFRASQSGALKPYDNPLWSCFNATTDLDKSGPAEATIPLLAKFCSIVSTMTTWAALIILALITATIPFFGYKQRGETMLILVLTLFAFTRLGKNTYLRRQRGLATPLVSAG